ncbi:hypothetical protein AVEN_43611-1 [Araneus ventricosus]|uniref:Uncharacterized protein n=1 Tax=Araneus ventricosus TaxID=182803 RepID=A0A4Y2TQ04_ARAVE|nr:hypothetical protein AVEN_43611-1 [Araneus ventricosus]
MILRKRYPLGAMPGDGGRGTVPTRKYSLEQKHLPLPVTAKTHYAAVATAAELIYRNAMGFRPNPGGESYTMLLCNIPLGFHRPCCKNGTRYFHMGFPLNRKDGSVETEVGVGCSKDRIKPSL